MNITYEDKVALIENEDIPDINKCNASDMNQIKEVVNSKANVIKLLTVSDEAPASCETGDKYYNTADEVIYTAIDTDEWGTDGEEPVQGYVYLDVENSKLYCYDGTTFSSYGGGTPSEVVISEEEPEATEEHKIWIDSDEVINSGTEVVDSLAGNESNLAPSVRAVNEKLNGTILYEDESGIGTEGNIVLNDEYLNYDEIEIFFNRYTHQSSIRIKTNVHPSAEPNTVYFECSLVYFSGSILRIYTSTYTILQKNVTKTAYTYWNTNSTAPTIDRENQITITKIVGYK